MAITFSRYLGKRYDKVTGPFPKTITQEFTLNSPVGTVVDQFNRIWVADTGNNRIVITDKNFQKIQLVITADNFTGSLNMPFRLAHHPSKPWIYATDVGKDMVYVISYDEKLNIDLVTEFGDKPADKLHGPNGIALHAYDDGVVVFIAEEFFPGPDNMSRIRKTDEKGKTLGYINTVKNGAKKIDILWPQGIDTDPAGNLYIANTGFTSVVRCDRDGTGVNFKAENSPEIDGFKIPRGVSVINNIMYVPDSTTNFVSAYDLDGNLKDQIVGYIAPIQISAYTDKDHLIVTNPITASIVIHKLSDWGIGEYQLAAPVAAIDNPRDLPGQYNFVTCSFDETQSADSSQSSIPSSVDPVTQMSNWMIEMWTWPYRWWQYFYGNETIASEAGTHNWNSNPGNYQVLRWQEKKNDYQTPRDMLIPPMVGGICLASMDINHVDHPLLEGINKLYFISDFYTGTINVYAYNPIFDELFFYSFFGGLGEGKAQLTQPQGMTIDQATGKIYIADSHNNRISIWQMDKVGFFKHVKNIGKTGTGDGEFMTPTDVALDAQGNMYVTDQFNNRIQIFNKAGKYQFAFGKTGYGAQDDHLFLPTSLDIDGDKLIVNDLVNRAIKIFDLKGNFIESFSGLGGEPGSGSMWMPYIIRARDGEVFVADSTLNIVNVYAYSTTKAKQAPSKPMQQMKPVKEEA